MFTGVHFISNARKHLAFIGLVMCLLFPQSASAEQPFTYYEFDMINVIYKTDDVKTYRELLPKVFDMPDKLYVRVFVADYYKMDKATKPYREAAVYLLAKYKGERVWHNISMPVTSNVARVAGILYLGFPKIMGDVRLSRKRPVYSGEFRLQGNMVMRIELDTKAYNVTPQVEGTFQRFAGIRSMNIRNGRVIDVKFGGSGNILEASKQFPQRLIVRPGKAKVILKPNAAASHSEKLVKAYSLKPTSVVLGYYLNNKFTMRFGN